MSAKLPFPEIVLLAEGFAMCAHRNQRRESEDAPYMVHPIRVAHFVHEYIDDANVIAATMMHDVLEDTDVTAEEMRWVFGGAITDPVLEVTDVSRPSDGKRAVRKEKDKDRDPTPPSGYLRFHFGSFLRRQARGQAGKCQTTIKRGGESGRHWTEVPTRAWRQRLIGAGNRLRRRAAPAKPCMAAMVPESLY